MPIRNFKCPTCGKIHSKIQKKEIVREHKCECGYEGRMEMNFKKANTSVQTDVDWTFRKDDTEIADHLVPDENGNYKDPY